MMDSFLRRLSIRIPDRAGWWQIDAERDAKLRFISDHGQEGAHGVLRDGHMVRYAESWRLLPGKVEVEPAPEQPLGKMRETKYRILHGLTEEAPAKQVVVNGNAQVIDEMSAFGAVKEIHVVAPAGEEKLPLQV